MQAQGLPPLGPAASLELAWLNIAQLLGGGGGDFCLPQGDLVMYSLRWDF
jgi:hypothetical protein